MLNQKLKLGLDDIEHLTGEGEKVIRDAMRLGDLESFLVGRRRFATPAAVQKWVDYLKAQSDAGKPVCYRKRPENREVA